MIYLNRKKVLFRNEHSEIVLFFEKFNYGKQLTTIFLLYHSLQMA